MKYFVTKTAENIASVTYWLTDSWKTFTEHQIGNQCTPKYNRQFHHNAIIKHYINVTKIVLFSVGF